MSSSIVDKGRAQPDPARSAVKRYVAVDGLRGVAALALLTTHVAMIQGLLGTRQLGGNIASDNPLGGFFAGGLQIFAGVFFVLTGLFVYRPFVRSAITGVPRNRNGSVLRRVLRLLPAYYLMYVVVLVLLNLNQVNNLWYVLRPALLLHIYDWGGWINGMEITWTVPDMAQFYLLLPIMAWLVFRYARRGTTERARAYRMLLPVPFLFAAGIAWLVYSQAHNLGTRALFWYPMGLMPEIGIGMVIAAMLELSKASPNDMPRLLRWAGQHRELFLLGGLVCLLINCARPGSEIGMDDIYSLNALAIFYGLLAVMSLCIMVALVAPGRRSPLVDAIFTNRVILYIGKVSYGVYLWQFAVMHFYLQQPSAYFDGNPQPLLGIRGGTTFWQLELFTLGVTLVIATASYYLMERPLMNWGERVIARRARRKLAAASPAGGRESVPV